MRTLRLVDAIHGRGRLITKTGLAIPGCPVVWRAVLAAGPRTGAGACKVIPLQMEEHRAAFIKLWRENFYDTERR